MFCNKCGKQNAEGSSFCSKCGNGLQKRTAASVAQTSGTVSGNNRSITYDWFYHLDGQSYGPLPESELRKLITDGKLSSDTFVFSSNPEHVKQGWVKISETKFATSRNTTHGQTRSESQTSATVFDNSRSATHEWYYHLDGQSYGPIPKSELKKLIADRRLLSDTLVWSNDPYYAERGWIKISETEFTASRNSTRGQTQIESQTNHGFKEFVDNHVRTTTKFQSADDLLKNAKPFTFIWFCIGVPAIVGLILGGPLGLMIFGILFGYGASFIASGIIRIRYSSRFHGEFTGDINIEDLFIFLNGHLKHIHPDFHEWGYMSNKSIFAIYENAISNAMKEVQIYSEFGPKRKTLAAFYIKPKTVNAKPGEKLYFVGARRKGFLLDGNIAGFLGHGTLIRTAPILQAAMEYYLTQNAEGSAFRSKCDNGFQEETAASIANTQSPFSESKKKSNKLIFGIAGIAVIAIIVIAVALSGGSGGGGGQQQQRPAVQQRTGGNRIVIGETKSFDIEYIGNMEVTLDYVEFIDRIENPLWPEVYEFPDEGSIFLRVALTLRNIGTERGDLMISPNTVVYDNTFEFGYHTSDGQLTGINPLTPPTTGSITFMVPTIVAESNKSLVINFNSGGGGRPAMSFVIRPAAGDSVGRGTSDRTGSGITTSNPGASMLNEGSNYSSEIIGRWRVIDGYEWHDWFKGGEIIEFFADGTGVESLDGVVFNFTWWAGISLEIFYEADEVFEDEILVLRMVYEDFEFRYFLHDNDGSILYDSQLLLYEDAGPPLALERH